MNKFLTKGKLAVFIVLAVLIIDQIIKIWVKTNMYWHESIRITDWFYIYFTENNGIISCFFSNSTLLARLILLIIIFSSKGFIM